MISTGQQTAHPEGGDCNSYCRDGIHAILALGRLLSDEGTPTTPDDIVAGMTPYYREVGWTLLSARQAETTVAHVVASMQTQGDGTIVGVEGFATEESPVSQDSSLYDLFAPWLLLLRPGEGGEIDAQP